MHPIYNRNALFKPLFSHPNNISTPPNINLQNLQNSNNPFIFNSLKILHLLHAKTTHIVKLFKMAAVASFAFGSTVQVPTCVCESSVSGFDRTRVLRSGTYAFSRTYATDVILCRNMADSA